MAAYGQEFINPFERLDPFRVNLDSANETTNHFESIAVNHNIAPSQEEISFEWSLSELTQLDKALPTLSDLMHILNTPSFNDKLKKSVQEMQDNNITLSNTIIGGTSAISTGLSVGYLIWTLRSGILMSSLLSSLPAWRFVDPLPILEGKINQDDDQESLESLIESSAEAQDAQQEVNRV